MAADGIGRDDVARLGLRGRRAWLPSSGFALFGVATFRSGVLSRPGRRVDRDSVPRSVAFAWFDGPHRLLGPRRACCFVAAMACFLAGWVVLGIAAIRLDRPAVVAQPGMNRLLGAARHRRRRLPAVGVRRSGSRKGSGDRPAWRSICLGSIAVVVGVHRRQADAAPTLSSRPVATPLRSPRTACTCARCRGLPRQPVAPIRGTTNSGMVYFYAGLATWLADARVRVRGAPPRARSRDGARSALGVGSARSRSSASDRLELTSRGEPDDLRPDRLDRRRSQRRRLDPPRPGSRARRPGRP